VQKAQAAITKQFNLMPVAMVYVLSAQKSIKSIASHNKECTISYRCLMSECFKNDLNGGYRRVRIVLVQKEAHKAEYVCTSAPVQDTTE
jgi:hypothetical protein